MLERGGAGKLRCAASIPNSIRKSPFFDSRPGTDPGVGLVAEPSLLQFVQ
jgi:hypothetical protein